MQFYIQTSLKIPIDHGTHSGRIDGVEKSYFAGGYTIGEFETAQREQFELARGSGFRVRAGRTRKQAAGGLQERPAPVAILNAGRVRLDQEATPVRVNQRMNVCAR